MLDFDLILVGFRLDFDSIWLDFGFRLDLDSIRFLDFAPSLVVS